MKVKCSEYFVRFYKIHGIMYCWSNRVVDLGQDHRDQLLHQSLGSQVFSRYFPEPEGGIRGLSRRKSESSGDPAHFSVLGLCLVFFFFLPLKERWCFQTSGNLWFQFRPFFIDLKTAGKQKFYFHLLSLIMVVLDQKHDLMCDIHSICLTFNLKYVQNFIIFGFQSGNLIYC